MARQERKRDDTSASRDDNGQMGMGDIKVKDTALSKELRERLGIDDNLGTTAKQTVMVWACLAKRRH